MKINMELITSMITTSRNQTQGTSSFEQLVNASKNNKDGDAYYLQHQTDLQQSALTFCANAKQINAKANTEVPVSEEVINKDTNPLLPNSSSIKQAQEMQTNNELWLAHTARLDNELKELGIAAKKPVLRGIALTEGKKNDEPTNLADKIKALPQKAVLNDSVIKNHQLYISNNAAELTLNTSQLSKEETRALEKLVKQWLGNKGLILKTLIINGVEQ